MKVRVPIRLLLGALGAVAAPFVARFNLRRRRWYCGFCEQGCSKDIGCRRRQELEAALKTEVPE